MSDHETQQGLDALASRCGIAADYYDNWGRRHLTSERTKRAVLAAMGYELDRPEAIRAAVLAWDEAPWRQPCEPVLVRRIDQPLGSWSFSVPVEEEAERALCIEWEILDESGRLQHKGEAGPGLVPIDSRVLDGRRHARYEVPVPSGLDCGYYDLTAHAKASDGGVRGMMRLILVPSRCYLPPSFQAGGRIWGVRRQRYALRSSRNWGIGDFGDLAEIVERAATDLGVGVVGLNPLHALKNEKPYHISPYSPDSRLFLNVLYVAVEQVPELAESEPARRLIEAQAFQCSLTSLRASDLVDYDRVYAAKMAVLEALFETFYDRHLCGQGEQPATERGQAFWDYVRLAGEPLDRFALFQSLSEEMRRRHPDIWEWKDWPAPYRNSLSPEVVSFRKTQAKRVRFHQYLQWIADEQIAAVAQRTKTLGMPLGLYHDLALGSSRSGSDAWVFQDVLALTVDSGCPPDAFALEGQNWGFPPMDPHRLKASRYRLFVELLRSNLANGGALRLDHVMGLFRLFWIPQGLPASEGTYVAYPFEDLLGILALESMRHRVMIVGEDLGTVPDEVRASLAAAGVLSYRVLYFERQADGRWKDPSAYPNQAVAVVTTHDLPTLAGYWSGQDLEIRRGLGLLPDERTWRQAQEEREQDGRRLLDALQAEGLWPEQDRTGPLPPMTEALASAMHLFLARTPCWVVLTALDDVVGERLQTNVPGTLDEYPNWSRKLTLPLDTWRELPALARLADAFKQAGRASVR
ncbi:MAG: 4-alpha-glucanotransferase [Nitrospiraceae bacterium]